MIVDYTRLGEKPAPLRLCYRPEISATFPYEIRRGMELVTRGTGFVQAERWMRTHAARTGDVLSEASIDVERERAARRAVAWARSSALAPVHRIRDGKVVA